MMRSLLGLDFDDAIRHLEANSYQRLAEGDWAYVYQAPHTSRVVRITPYDPAYLLFVQTCWLFPHRNLPSYYALIRLAGSGYAVEMPCYTREDSSLREDFLAALEAAMVAESDGSELAFLAQILKRGIAAGKLLVPYLFGLDMNLDNVMLEGRTPKLVDGFGQAGAIITEGIAKGLPLELNRAEIESFLTIPFHRRGQKQYRE
ncbi:MAG: hypothetical protein KDE53_26895 [Caldilineaceae bacterium]|nr:hypothetical protein [Caldilineaceae bacterium]